MARPRDPAKAERIQQAACELFGTLGYHHTQVSDIAAKVGAGHGTIYRYFDNKRDIYQHVLVDALGRFATALMPHDPRGPDSLESFAAHLRAIGGELIRAYAEDPRDLAVVLEAGSVDDDAANTVSTALQALMSLTEERLRNGIERGFLRDDLDVEVCAASINAVTLEAVRRVASTGASTTEAERWADATVSFIVDGVS